MDSTQYQVGRVFWQPDFCQFDQENGAHVDNIISSIHQMVRRHGFMASAIEGHYSQTSYCVQSHVVFKLNFIYDIPIRRHSNSTESCLEIKRKITAVDVTRPVFLITGDEELISSIYRHMKNRDVVVCAPRLTPFLQLLAKNNGCVIYEWNRQSGVGNMM